MKGRLFFTSHAKDHPTESKNNLKTAKHFAIKYKDPRMDINVNILKSSPCLRCSTFSNESACPDIESCAKLDEFQRAASACCSLFKTDNSPVIS